jgi:hypothetical protein
VEPATAPVHLTTLELDWYLRRQNEIRAALSWPRK